MYSKSLEKFNHKFVKWAGSTTGFNIAMLFTISWIIAGEFSGFSLAWEKSFYICMTIVSFLLFFILQRSQNKELMALHLKLNELIAVTQKADNKLINIEEHSEKNH